MYAVLHDTITALQYQWSHFLARFTLVRGNEGESAAPLHLTGLQLAQLHVDGHLLASPVDLHGNRLARIFADQGIPSLSEEALGEGRN